MDKIQLLISGYLDDELTDDEREQLAATLASDTASVDRFVYDSFIHFQLLNWMDQQRVQDRATAAVLASVDGVRHGPTRRAFAHDDTRIHLPANGTEGARGMLVARSRFWSLGALAATLLVAASLSLLAYNVASRPVIVGQLTSATGSRWETQPDIAVGALLHDGQELSLMQGTALITFVNGAQLLLEAPVSLRLDSAMDVHLRNGRIAAKVPTPARGFTVTSSLARFVDLGTAFSLKLDADKSFQLHVFEGLVELLLAERFGDAVHHPLRVAEVRAVAFDVNWDDVAWLEFEVGKQMPF